MECALHNTCYKEPRSANNFATVTPSGLHGVANSWSEQLDNKGSQGDLAHCNDFDTGLRLASNTNTTHTNYQPASQSQKSVSAAPQVSGTRKR